jgi:hypothetical protein
MCLDDTEGCLALIAFWRACTKDGVLCCADPRAHTTQLHRAEQGEGVVGLPGVRSPPPPDYKDVTKPLRRMLKQLGSGSLSRGGWAGGE